MHPPTYLSPSVSTAVTNISWVMVRSELAPRTTKEPRHGGGWERCSEGGGTKFSRFDGKQKTIMIWSRNQNQNQTWETLHSLKHVPRPKMNVFSSSQWRRVLRLVKVRCRNQMGKQYVDDHTDWHTTKLRIDLDTRWIKQRGKKRCLELGSQGLWECSSQLLDPAEKFAWFWMGVPWQLTFLTHATETLIKEIAELSVTLVQVSQIVRKTLDF